MRDGEKLDAETAEALAQSLKARHAKLAGSARNAMSQRRLDPEASETDLAGRATATLQDEIQASLLDRHRRELAEIEAALQRLDRGEYGFCHDCDAFIGLARLIALPFAWRCGHCQGRADSRGSRATQPIAARVGTSVRSSARRRSRKP